MFSNYYLAVLVLLISSIVIPICIVCSIVTIYTWFSDPYTMLRVLFLVALKDDDGWKGTVVVYIGHLFIIVIILTS